MQSVITMGNCEDAFEVAEKKEEFKHFTKSVKNIFFLKVTFLQYFDTSSMACTCYVKNNWFVFCTLKESLNMCLSI